MKKTNFYYILKEARNDDSKLLISDNADLFFNHSYYGNPR